MSVLRQQNWLGQQRIDVPHLRAVESSICADFDVLAGRMMSGSTPVVIQGFDTVTTNAIGQPASNLQINVANASVMHFLATESGTIFWVPSTRPIETLNVANTRLKGSFVANTKNYVGIDLVRSADSTTADLVQFLNPVSNLETSKSVPLARTLDYVIYVSTQDFSTTPNICPLAIVVTDTSNNVSSVTDARNMMFRLGNGGSNANPLNTYSWPGGRTELGTNADFSAADKKIASLKDWMNAIMTRLWEIGGGEHWYSSTGWHNVQLVRTGTSVFSSTGDYFEWTGTNLHWKSLRFIFSNSSGYYNDIQDQTTDSAGLTDLADGQCVYVDLDRTQNRVAGTNPLIAVKGTTATLGSPAIPGSRVIFAWRSGSNIYTRGNSYYVGAASTVATTTAVGAVKLHQASLTPAAPVALTDGDLNTATGVLGLDANKSASIAATGGSTALDITGSGTGSAVVTHGVSGNDAAQIKFEDYSGNVRYVIDHLGFPSGRRSEVRENWLEPSPTFGSGYRWTKAISGASVTTGVNGAANTGGPMPESNNYYAGMSNASIGDHAVVYSSNPFVAPQTYTSLVVEFEYLIQSITGATIMIGLMDSGSTGTASAPTSANSLVSVGYRSGVDTNGFWMIFTSNGTTFTATQTTVPFTSSITSFRIELHMSGSPYGSKARVFINGTLTEVTATLPSWHAVSFQMGSWCTAAGASTQTYVGPIYATWNRNGLSLPSV